LWIRQQLKDFCVDTGCIPIFCDNTSAINISKNPCQHKRTKHIDIRHHFLRDNIEKELITINFCATNKQIADIFTKALSREQFERSRLELGLIKITWSFLLTLNAWLVKRFCRSNLLKLLVAVKLGAIFSTCVDYSLLTLVEV